MPAQNRQEEIQKLINAIQPRLESHIGTLSVRRSQLVRKDHYGRIIREEWDAELDYFILHFIYGSNQANFNGAKSQVGAYVGSTFERILKIIDVAASEWSENRAGFNWNDLNPINFEVACCTELQNSGWDAQLTRATGDQGIDVIAKSGDLKLVVQCKKYQEVVGNKAVQEIIAGREFERANFAAVVSVTDFTRSAHQLAASANVLLLHPDKIKSLLDVNKFDTNADFERPDMDTGPQNLGELLNSYVLPLSLAEEDILAQKIKERENAMSPIEDDELLDEASEEVLVRKSIDVIRATRRASASTIQRRLRIGYDQAARVLDVLEERGIVGPENGSSPREILVDLDKI